MLILQEAAHHTQQLVAQAKVGRNTRPPAVAAGVMSGMMCELNFMHTAHQHTTLHNNNNNNP
jgi:hypothetical protein